LDLYGSAHYPRASTVPGAGIRRDPLFVRLMFVSGARVFLGKPARMPVADATEHVTGSVAWAVLRPRDLDDPHAANLPPR